MGLWGSQDILMAFEAGDPGSNPGRPVINYVIFVSLRLKRGKKRPVFNPTSQFFCSNDNEYTISYGISQNDPCQISMPSMCPLLATFPKEDRSWKLSLHSVWVQSFHLYMISVLHHYHGMRFTLWELT